MSIDRKSTIYWVIGICFLKFSSSNSTKKDIIHCPYLKYANLKIYSVAEFINHIYHSDIDSGYTN